MRCVLNAVASYNNGILKNKDRMITLMKHYSGRTDLLLFGEAWLHGFYTMEFDYGKDFKKAISINDPIVSDIKKSAAKFKIAVSFGFFEKSGNKIYSSQMTISRDGKMIDLYRRVSPGWKENYADEHYEEGTGFHTFEYLGRKILVGLCGDMWFDVNLNAIQILSPDLIFWPVYTDFSVAKWNTSIKYEYAEQVKGFSCPVLYVNSVCPDREEPDLAKGGAALFLSGEILCEVPSGAEREMMIEI